MESTAFSLVNPTWEGPLSSGSPGSIQIYWIVIAILFALAIVVVLVVIAANAKAQVLIELPDDTFGGNTGLYYGSYYSSITLPGSSINNITVIGGTAAANSVDPYTVIILPPAQGRQIGDELKVRIIQTLAVEDGASEDASFYFVENTDNFDPGSFNADMVSVYPFYTPEIIFQVMADPSSPNGRRWYGFGVYITLI